MEGFSGSENVSPLLLGPFVTLSREIGPGFVLLRGTTAGNLDVLAAEHPHQSGSIGFRLCCKGRFFSHPGPVRMPQGAHLGLFMPGCEVVCFRRWGASAKVLLGGSGFISHSAVGSALPRRLPHLPIPAAAFLPARE